MNILNIGSGPVSPGKTPGLEIINADRRDYGEFVERQNMEALTYPDNTFDLVVCVNALDHTPDAYEAVREMIRVCKPGGWVYIDCALIQHTTSGKNHHWDAFENGTLYNDYAVVVDLPGFGFKIEFVDNHGEKRYNHVICRFCKRTENV